MVASRSWLGGLLGVLPDVLFHRLLLHCTCVLRTFPLLIQTHGVLPGVPPLTQDMLDALLGDLDLAVRMNGQRMLNEGFMTPKSFGR